jgi:adenylate cyclase
MKRLPRAVRHLKSLQWLDISSNRIPELDHAGLEAIVGLRQILAQNNRLSNLPSSFAHMLSLKYLNISNNKFEQVPPVLCDMPNLVDLDISFNSISILPAEIGRLIALERLIIVGNQIDQFPPEVSRMISLRELDCRRNLISDLTPLSSLPRLESLLAEHNAIHILNFVIGPRLLTFNASNNRTAKSVLRPLVTGPASPAFALTTLDLSHLRLSSFDEEGAAALGAFKALITLKLDYNDFRSIPDIICTLTEIETLSATNNDLHNLPEEIGRLRKLRTFTVHNNNIKVVPESIWQCESLVELNMSSNSLDVWKDPATAPAPGLGAALESITDGVRNGSELTLAMERKASSVGTITMRTVPPLAYSLRRLLIADNYLGVANRTSTFDIFHTLSLMRELRVLNLSFNQITELPTTHLQAFANLHELYLSGNNLTSIPGESLQKISKLKVLHLNGNKLQTLPAELGKVVGLETLDVGNNLLKYNVANWQYDWNWCL